MNFLLACCLFLADRIAIQSSTLPWDSTPACYVDSIYQIVYPKIILKMKIMTAGGAEETETLDLDYEFVSPDTYFVKFPKRLKDFRVNLILHIRTDGGLVSQFQRLRLYKGERRVIVYRDVRPQIMRVFEGDSLINEFLVSTGREGRQTALGKHRILTKYRLAWFAEGRSWMTDWQGFHKIGKRINGLHSLPGNKYEKILGRPASHGCVRVSRKTGKWLYDWTDIGVPIEIKSKN